MAYRACVSCKSAGRYTEALRHHLPTHAHRDLLQPSLMHSGLDRPWQGTRSTVRVPPKLPAVLHLPSISQRLYLGVHADDLLAPLSLTPCGIVDLLLSLHQGPSPNLNRYLASS